MSAKISILLSVLILIILTSCKEAPKEITFEMPREIKAFRSVLDNRSRILTLPLHDNMWLAYDVSSATLYKAWKGGVHFDGAVYTTSQGPQPSTKGLSYHTKEKEVWTLLKDGQEYQAKVNYLGHQFKADKTIIKFELISPEGDKIKLTETPEYQQSETQSGIIRNFSIQNNTDYQLALYTEIGALENVNDFSTNAEFVVMDSLKEENAKGILISLSGKLLLKGSTTSLSYKHHPEFDAIAGARVLEQIEEDLPQVHPGLTLIGKSDCKSCHNEVKKTVGPSYIEIARKYHDTEETIEQLSYNIIKGSKNRWGDAQMIAHPALEKEDAEEMIRYIIALDDKEDKTIDKLKLGIESKKLELTEKYTAGPGKGLMAHIYYAVPASEFHDLEKSFKPVRQGPTAALHILSHNHFGEKTQYLCGVYSGSINIEKDDNYSFRLIADDAGYLFVNDSLLIDNGGSHAARAVDGNIELKPGKHKIKVLHRQGFGGAFLSLQWFNKETQLYELVDSDVLSFDLEDVKETIEYIPSENDKPLPGHGSPVSGLHPSTDLFQARPDDFKPMVGGIDFLSDGRMVICNWEGDGPVYLIENWDAVNIADIKVKKIASGLAEPLGIKVVNDEIYVLQKQELTKLIDHDGDNIIDEYRTHSYDWDVSSNYHEFAFGLVYQDSFFYATLATAILDGGMSVPNQIKDRGKVIKISEADGSVEFIAHGLRTPNTISEGIDGEMFVADTQGDWVPASKLVHVKKDAFYGTRSVDLEGTKDLKVTMPVIFFQQDEIANSPSGAIYLKNGPYAGQMLVGEVTLGGVKRLFIEKVNGNYQGVVFRFTQGLEAGINRICEAPDGSLILGGVGGPGTWGHHGRLWYGLQRLQFNEQVTFEMFALKAFSNGFEIELTEALAANEELRPDDFKIKQWYYQATAEYGGPKMGEEVLQASKISLSDDRRKIWLEIPDLKEERVVYFQLNHQLKSETNQRLWSTEAWYTLNAIPIGKPLISRNKTLTSNTK